MQAMAFFLIVIAVATGMASAAEASCCDAEGCGTCSRSECLQGPAFGSWSCGSYEEKGTEDDCLFLTSGNCITSQTLGSPCVDAEGREGFCEVSPPADRSPSWAHGLNRICARRVEGEGRCNGARKYSGELEPRYRLKQFTEAKRARTQRQEQLVERMVSLLRQRDEKPVEQESLVL
eukprot:TRINITY_DN1925_c0_g1_i2.p1 TRINITY_DN1925_c0_g1~~TRINITY_DN1925_c0_g1_i2.p1  ORF type:complete len:177 (-),score=41.26 TRINITY_DN1925_c0_g1_i2:163-693(-)